MSDTKNTIAVDDSNWDSEVIESAIPVLVDFWAEWCGPCKAIAPALEELAGEMKGKLKIAKVDVDESNQIAARHGIRSIPSLLLFKNGTVQTQMVGAMSKSALKEKLSAYL